GPTRRRRGSPDAAARQLHHDPRSGRIHADELHDDGVRHAARDRARLSAHGRELPVVDRSTDHPDGAAGCDRGGAVDPVADPDQHLRAGADGGDHVHRGGDQQLQPAGHLRERPAPRGDGLARRRTGRGRRPPAPRADDRLRDDSRHAADVAGSRRRRRAERAPRPRRDRRLARGHLRHAVLRPRRLQSVAAQAGANGHRSGAGKMNTTEAFVERPAVGIQTAKPRRRHAVVAGIVVVFALLAVAGLVPRVRLWNRLAAHAEAEKNSLPKVTTARAERAPADVDVPLPGTTQPWLTTGIYARIDGYLRARYVDIGDHVTAGQLIADIEAPEVDQQLNQARGTLAQSKATLVQLQADLELARRTAKRFVGIGVGAVTQQEIDDRTTAATTAQKAVDAGEATVGANQAAVDRLEQLTGFERVYAPFDGGITARNVDPGSLITAGSTQQTTQLFSLAQVDVLRIFVYVPQAYAFDVRVGQSAAVALREQPDRVFKGTVTRTADAIDPGSGTLLTDD